MVRIVVGDMVFVSDYGKDLCSSNQRNTVFGTTRSPHPGSYAHDCGGIAGVVACDRNRIDFPGRHPEMEVNRRSLSSIDQRFTALMSEVTSILLAIEQGHGRATEDLLPLVYDELRALAAAKLAQEKPGQTLQATALVHEAYVRLVHVDQVEGWNSRGHFFGAAAEAMRRILIDNARRKQRLKHGGDRRRVDLEDP